MIKQPFYLILSRLDRVIPKFKMLHFEIRQLNSLVKWVKSSFDGPDSKGHRGMKIPRFRIIATDQSRNNYEM